jgi:ribonucleoside-diphosphate reductase alpha chain/ribonucleoside-triphosphate reductase
MKETLAGEDKELADRISGLVAKCIREDITVEDIQDIVEFKLMSSNRKDVAKKYILYREARNQTRVEDEEALLDSNFISKYKHSPSKMTPLGEFVYYRTYSRWLPQKKRRETWLETCKRAIEYNISLDKTSEEVLLQQILTLYHNSTVRS